MSTVKLLDCTLRDGGYVNNWNFGAEAIAGIIHTLETAGTNIVELGFLRDEVPDKNRTIFASIEDANVLMKEKKDIVYSAMIEAFNPYPLEKISVHTEDGVDLLRICIWKRCMDEHMQYCKAVVDKGYQISVQPSRVEQYNDYEFVEMLKRSNDLNPYSVYVVDTWGTQSPAQIMHYLELADQHLDRNIKIGYHGHNNKLQALSCAQSAIQLGMDRDVCIDASIMGMGRGAGNLNTEVIMEYLNETFNCKYDVQAVLDAFVDYLKPIYDAKPWGYSVYHFLTAVYGANPNYGTYFAEKKDCVKFLRHLLCSLTEQEKILFSSELVEQRRRVYNEV